jgi:hypothetical protein
MKTMNNTGMDFGFDFDGDWFKDPIEVLAA